MSSMQNSAQHLVSSVSVKYVSFKGLLWGFKETASENGTLFVPNECPFSLLVMNTHF